MILFWLILIPFLGGMLCWHSERWGEQAPRWIGLHAVRAGGQRRALGRR